MRTEKLEACINDVLNSNPDEDFEMLIDLSLEEFYSRFHVSENNGVYNRLFDAARKIIFQRLYQPVICEAVAL